MTNNEKYNEVLTTLGEVLKEKNTRINAYAYRLEKLQEQLNEAEKIIEELKEEKKKFELTATMPPKDMLYNIISNDEKPGILLTPVESEEPKIKKLVERAIKRHE